jgi:hypothetical protein
MILKESPTSEEAPPPLILSLSKDLFEVSHGFIRGVALTLALSRARERGFFVVMA